MTNESYSSWAARLSAAEIPLAARYQSAEPILWRGSLVYPMYTEQIGATPTTVTITLVSAAPPAGLRGLGMGLSVVDGYVELQGRALTGVDAWSDALAAGVGIEVTPTGPGALVTLTPVWVDEFGTQKSWSGNYGIVVEQQPDGRNTLWCSIGEGPPNFANLVVTVGTAPAAVTASQPSAQSVTASPPVARPEALASPPTMPIPRLGAGALGARSGTGSPLEAKTPTATSPSPQRFSARLTSSLLANMQSSRPTRLAADPRRRATQEDTAAPDTTQRQTARLDATQPEATRAGSNPPRATQPTDNRPDTTQPADNPPGPTQPTDNPPGPTQAVGNPPGTTQPGTDRLDALEDTTRTGATQASARTPDTTRAGTDLLGTPRPDPTPLAPSRFTAAPAEEPPHASAGLRAPRSDATGSATSPRKGIEPDLAGLATAFPKETRSNPGEQGTARPEADRAAAASPDTVRLRDEEPEVAPSTAARPEMTRPAAEPSAAPAIPVQEPDKTARPDEQPGGSTGSAADRAVLTRPAATHAVPEALPPKPLRPGVARSERRRPGTGGLDAAGFASWLARLESEGAADHAHQGSNPAPAGGEQLATDTGKALAPKDIEAALDEPEALSSGPEVPDISGARPAPSSDEPAQGAELEHRRPDTAYDSDRLEDGPRPGATGTPQPETADSTRSAAAAVDSGAAPAAPMDAEPGYGSALYDLGVAMLALGEEQQACGLWEQAAAAGHPGAAYELGAFRHRQGDSAAAERWWRLAATGRDRRAMTELAELLDRRGDPEALTWRARAGEPSSAPASSSAH